MSLVTRPVKQGGFLTFAQKVFGGFPNILPAEFDADWQAIVNVVNGFIDATNIAAGSITNALISATAAIATSKIAADAGITNAYISPTAAIQGTKLAVGASIDLLLPGAAVAGAYSGGADSVFITLTSLSGRGGPTFISATIGGNLLMTSAADVATFKVKRDGATIATWNVSAIQNLTVAMPIPSIAVWDPTPGLGGHIYTATVAFTGAGGFGSMVVTAPVGQANYTEFT